jgi:hypothetical protein
MKEKYFKTKYRPVDIPPAPDHFSLGVSFHRVA